MRFHYTTVKDGKNRIFWPGLAILFVLIYSVVIGLAEGFWYLFTGGVSPLMGGYALVAATLVLIRVVGAGLAAPIRYVDSGL